EKQITSAIDENGYVMDSASVKLRGIRSSIRDLESRVRERLNNVTRSKSKMLSDSIITIRNDRYVLPVNSEYRVSICGIVHDEGSSGQTLFIESQAVVVLNNRFHQTRLNESFDVERILNDFTTKKAEYNAELSTNKSILSES